MYDKSGNLKRGYTNERSEDYILRNLETGNAIARRLRTPNEAADLNADLRETNQRWVPFNPNLDIIQAIAKHSLVDY